MRNIKILNSRGKKRILKMLCDRFGFDKSALEDCVFMLSGQRIYITNRDLEKINTEHLKIDNVGLYIATLEDKMKNKSIRLSIEGSQIIGPSAEKNVAVINEELFKQWISGRDIIIKDYEKLEPGFVIVKFGGDFVGSGLFLKKDSTIKNYVPKERRLKKFFE